jgi:hypothetical protein
LSAAFPRPAPPARRSDRSLSPVASAPPRHVFSPLRFDIRGLRCEKTRRGTAVPNNLPGQATNLHGGLLRLVDSQLSASETPFLFSIAPSHMCLNPDSRPKLVSRRGTDCRPNFGCGPRCACPRRAPCRTGPTELRRVQHQVQHVYSRQRVWTSKFYRGITIVQWLPAE